MKSEKSSKITQKGPSIVYVRSFLDNESPYTVAMAKENMAKVQNQLLSEGYTMYLDGYSTYFFNDTYYQAAQQMEQSGNMNSYWDSPMKLIAGWILRSPCKKLLRKRNSHQQESSRTG